MMKDFFQVKEMRATENAALLQKALSWIGTIPKRGVETILLSGSLARGDYWPGELGGMVDIILLTEPGGGFDPERVLGPNEASDIPYHCVKRDGCWYALAVMDLPSPEAYLRLDEARRWSFEEALLLEDLSGRWTAQAQEREALSRVDRQKAMEGCLGYAGYLLSEYKEGRWRGREAALQLHANLDTAIGMGIKCLYYLNGRSPAPEDRRLYYCLSLDDLPAGFQETLGALLKRDASSLEDYDRRKRLFDEGLIDFLYKSKK